MSSLPTTHSPVAPVATPAAMLFPRVLNRNKVVSALPTNLPKKSLEQEARELMARAVQHAEQEERHRLALMKSFAGVRTEFLDLDGQTGPKTIRVRGTSPGPSTPTRSHPFLQSHHAPEAHPLHALDSHGDYIFNFGFADILRPASPPPSPIMLYSEPEQLYVHEPDSDTESDSDTIRPTSRRQSAWDSAVFSDSNGNQAALDEDGGRQLRPASRPASRLGFWADDDDSPRTLTVRNGAAYVDGASLVRTRARSCKSH